MTAFPYVTFWQYFDGQWTQFRDCQIAGCDIECTNDGDGFMRLTLTVIGLAPEKKVAEPTAPNEETDKVHWLDSGGYNMLSGDYLNMDHSDVPTTQAELISWLTTRKTIWNAHCAVASGRHHKAADTTNLLTYDTPCADLAACYVALDEIEAKHEAHRVNTTVHYFADDTNILSWTTPDSLEKALACAEIVIGHVNSPGVHNRHLGATPGAKSLKLSFQMTAKGVQGEGITAYAIHRAPGTITGATDLLLEDFRLINLAKFGNIKPAIGAETTSEIQTMSLYRKFIASTSGNERSISIYIPEFELDPEPLMTIMGGPEGMRSSLPWAARPLGPRLSPPSQWSMTSPRSESQVAPNPSPLSPPQLAPFPPRCGAGRGPQPGGQNMPREINVTQYHNEPIAVIKGIPGLPGVTWKVRQPSPADRFAVRDVAKAHRKKVLERARELAAEAEARRAEIEAGTEADGTDRMWSCGRGWTRRLRRSSCRLSSPWITSTPLCWPCISRPR
jgi:hypothetical protein